MTDDRSRRGRGRWWATAAATALAATGLGSVLAPGAAQAAPVGTGGRSALAPQDAAPAANPPQGVQVFPSPGTPTATPGQEFSFIGVTGASLPRLSVVGSASGPHSGRFVLQSSGHGATWMPDRPFRPGESVTITSSMAVAGAGRVIHYTVARPAALTATQAQQVGVEDDTPGATPAHPGTRAAAPDVTTAAKTDTDTTTLAPPAASPAPFVTQPTLHPPAIATTPRAGLAPGDLFTTPLSLASVMPAGTTNGAEISDDSGQPVWFLPVLTGALDLHVVTNYPGQSAPVLIYHQNSLCAECTTFGQWNVLNEHYQQIATIKAADGLQADGHDIQISPNGKYALLDSYDPIKVDATSVGGPSSLLTYEGIVQEIDLATGAMVYEWHSLGVNPANGEQYVPLKDSQVSVNSPPPYDYIHLNSLQYLPDQGNATTAHADGLYEIAFSARNVSTVFQLNMANSYVNWRLGGTDTRNQIHFTDGDGGPSYAHDVQIPAYDPATGALEVSLFDNGAGRTPASSRGVLYNVAPAAGGGTASVNTNWIATNPDAPAGSDGHTYGYVTGSNRLQTNGDQLIGYGSSGYADEFTPSGAVDFSSQMESAPPAGGGTPLQTFSYRTLRDDRWVGLPLTPPAEQISEPSAGTVNVAVSWNGDTQVSRWVLYAGPSATNLSPVATMPKTTFETAITARIPPGASYFQVRAENAAGAVLVNGTTTPVPDPIAAEYARPGVATALGASTSGELPIATSGLYQTYQHGTIYWSPPTGAHEVQGAILQHYVGSLGGPTGILGFPTTDEQASGPVGAGGRVSGFQGGDIYWTASTGAHEVQGGILAHYLALQGPSGVLGFPTSDEGPVGPSTAGGRLSQFSAGDIFYSPATGALEVQGAILAHYLQLSGPSGGLGFPTSDEEASTGGGRQSTFQGGTIFWSAPTGAFEVQGAILAAYVSLGGPGSDLGFPTTDEFTPATNVRQSDFQNGHYIQYSYVTNKVTVH